jgi:O-antigen ligase
MNRTHVVKWLIYLPFIWLFTGMFWYGNGDKVLATLIIISSLTSILYFKGATVKENWHKSKWLWLLATASLYALFSYYYHDFSGREIRATIGAFLLLLTFPKLFTLKDKYIVYLLAIAGTVGVAFTSYYGIYETIERYNWPINALPYATICSVVAIVSLSFLLSTKAHRLITSYALFMSILAILLSESRGVFIAVIFASLLISVLFIARNRITKKTLIVVCLGISISSIIAWPLVETRIQKTQYELSQIQQSNLNTSFGLRLQFWQMTPDLVSKSPIIGIGGNLTEAIDALYAEGLASKDAHNFRPAHMHNQFIDKLVKNGIIGLALLLLILLYPLGQLRKLPPLGQFITIGLITLYGISGLTDMPLYHGQSLALYLLCIGLTMRLNTFENKVTTDNLTQ